MIYVFFATYKGQNRPKSNDQARHISSFMVMVSTMYQCQNCHQDFTLTLMQKPPLNDPKPLKIIPAVNGVRLFDDHLARIQHRAV